MDLDVSRSTVMRRISALEEGLKVRLFDRLPEGYFLTPAGERMMQAVAKMEEEVVTAERQLAGQDHQLSGTIRITLPAALAAFPLAEQFVKFRTLHPNIDLELITTYSMADLARREADIALRMSNDPPEDLVGRRLMKVARACYVAEGWQGASSAEQTDIPCIGWSSSSDVSFWFRQAGIKHCKVNSLIDDPFATLEAVRAGFGAAILPCFMADKAKGVKRLAGGSLILETDLWVLTHKDLRKTAKVRLFSAFISGALLDQRELLEGRCSGAG